MLWDVYESPCTAAQRPQAFNRSARVSLAGSSDPALCRSLVSQLFNSSSCHFSRCSFNGVFQPPVAGKFIAFSAFFYTMDFLRTVMGLPVATLQQLEGAVVTLCNQTWSEVRPAPTPPGLCRARCSPAPRGPCRCSLALNLTGTAPLPSRDMIDSPLGLSVAPQALLSSDWGQCPRP
ncbi:PREDICTED: ectonucleoside triphosphate diphosphohydrolase 2 [Bison bison bison]|uniref:Ectonucleoside triphosphate diphosphohydrolase 2 n=1 Tax=Bison bison bison TaxID=43346 RepID=A0A6P3HA24_BISBB|nr:PREDICTED: ectonucleoside triphosphate diphosphohydrolase 2 [Bison bison bison]